MVGIIASSVGWLGMGSLLTFLKPPPKTILWITMGISLLCMASYGVQMSITCERDHIIGLDDVLESEKADRDFYSRKDELGISTCMTNCSCSHKYSPVCVDDTHLFFSACHAGCTKQLTINGSLAYEDCACTTLTAPGESETEGKPPLRVESGVCSTGCSTFKYYIGIKIFTNMLISMNRVIANIIVFRSLNERDKDLALGVLNLILSAAFVFVPIFFGSLIDYSCVLWQRTCGRRGYCYLYNMDKYRWILHGVPVVGMILSFTTESMILKHHKDVDFFGQKEIEQLELLDILKTKATKKKKKQKGGITENTQTKVETIHKKEEIETTHKIEEIETTHKIEEIETTRKIEETETNHIKVETETPHKKEEIETTHKKVETETPHNKEETETNLTKVERETTHTNVQTETNHTEVETETTQT